MVAERERGRKKWVQKIGKERDGRAVSVGEVRNVWKGRRKEGEIDTGKRRGRKRSRGRWEGKRKRWRCRANEMNGWRW